MTNNPQLNVEVKGFEKFRKFIDLLAYTQLGSLLDAVGNQVANLIKKRIKVEKQSPEGKSWEALTPEYAKRKTTIKGGDVGLLQFEGHLLESIQHVVNNYTEVEVGSNLIYARTHQLGDHRVIKGKKGLIHRNIPARPYIGLSDENQDVVEETIKRWFDKTVAQGVLG